MPPAPPHLGNRGGGHALPPWQGPGISGPHQNFPWAGRPNHPGRQGPRPDFRFRITQAPPQWLGIIRRPPLLHGAAKPAIGFAPLRGLRLSTLMADSFSASFRFLKSMWETTCNHPNAYSPISLTHTASTAFEG